ncbi:MAG TPA: FmdB family zinc ribbon protein [Gemmatimonadales bacterium]|nr:FmdB family zinc ribbon protein [Gemmatimonadales bacterium]
MPTYHYRCPAGHDFDKFEKITAKGRARCPTCGRPAARQISGGAGLVFKGSGFYITDYGKDGKGARKPEAGEAKPAAEKPSAEPAAEKPKAEGKGGKPAGKGKAE